MVRGVLVRPSARTASFAVDRGVAVVDECGTVGEILTGIITDGDRQVVDSMTIEASILTQQFGDARIKHGALRAVGRILTGSPAVTIPVSTGSIIGRLQTKGTIRTGV